MKADFEPAFQKCLVLEGGMVLHEVAGDRGGQTFAGISRRHWPDWEGWDLIDRGLPQPGLTERVRAFYRKHFWDPSGVADIADQEIATMLFCFAVNAGIGTASRLAQHAAGVTADGIIGPVTASAINAISPPELYRWRYYGAMVERYTQIARDGSQLRFLRGWIRRARETVE